MERKTIDVIIGKAVDKKEAEKTDKSKVGEGYMAPPKGGDVGGRGGQAMWVEDPICGAMNYVYVDDDVYLYYMCWNTSVGRHYFKV